MIGTYSAADPEAGIVKRAKIARIEKARELFLRSGL
jgi:hypothetical protein